jgi:hypothetical protein
MKNIVLILLTFFVGYAHAQVIESSNDQIDFGVVLYENPQVLSIELTNLDDEEVSIEEFVFFDIYESSPFQVVNPPMSIPGNGSVTVDIQFDPVHNIDHNTELVIKTSGNRGSLSVDLRGIGEYPGSYYDLTQNEMDSDLKEAFSALLSDGQISQNYDAARDEMYLVIDNQAVNGQGSSENRLTRAYLGTDAVGYVSRGDLFNNYSVNTEHTFPQGNFNQNLPMRSDIHHLFPTDVNANSTRGSLRLGNVVSGVDWSEGGSQRGLNASGEQVFEPRDGQKGASARAILYFLLNYQNFGGHVSADMEAAMREWHALYPPTEVDVNRNEDIFAYQNNRNPLVDYPQFVHRVFSFRNDDDRPNVGELVVVDTEADFGQVEAEPAIYNVVLTNTGERFFSVSSIDVTGSGFSLAADQDDSFVLINGEAASIRVEFDPQEAQGLSSGILTFNTNLPSAPEVTVPLSADGVLSLGQVARAEVDVYPNPASEYFQLRVEQDELKEVRVYDMSGRVIRSFSNASLTYPIYGLETGVYLIEALFDDGRTGTERLVVTP